jgi:hypothetical protein
MHHEGRSPSIPHRINQQGNHRNVIQMGMGHKDMVDPDQVND